MANKYVDTSQTVNGDGLASGAATQGYQGCGLTGLTGASSTGLSASTTYYFKVAINGGASTQYSITTAATLTYTAIIALMNTAIGATASFAIVGGDLVCTSTAGGASAAIALAQGTSSPSLFSSLTGFTSFATAVAGTSGAWNNLLTCFAGTNASVNGNPAAGDIVYMRTYASGSNLSVSIGSAVTFSTTPTVTSPILWVADNGTVWAASNGILTITTAIANALIFKDYHNFYCAVQDALVWKSTQTTGGSAGLFVGASNVWTNNQIVLGTSTGTSNPVTLTLVNSGNNGHYVFNSCDFVIPSSNTTGNINLGFGGLGEFNGCNFDLNGFASGGSLFQTNSSGGKVAFNGGRVLNSLSTSYLLNTATAALVADNWSVTFDKFDTGSLQLVNPNASTSGYSNYQNVEMFVSGIPSGDQDFAYESQTLSASWRTGQNYPTLNSTLPDGTAWSLKVFPRTCSKGNPGKVFPMRKLATQSAATRTITVELLINNSYGTPTAQDWWIEVCYIDNSTSLAKNLTTYTPLSASNLTTSTAPWSTTVYGALNYNKFNIAITTPTAVKQWTEVLVTLKSTRTASLSTDFYFVDPDFALV